MTGRGVIRAAAPTINCTAVELGSKNRNIAFADT